MSTGVLYAALPGAVPGFFHVFTSGKAGSAADRAQPAESGRRVEQNNDASALRRKARLLTVADRCDSDPENGFEAIHLRRGGRFLSVMQRYVGPPSLRWKFHAWIECDEPEEKQTFADRNAALSWLTQFKTNQAVLADLRALVVSSGGADLLRGRSGDDQTLEAVAALIIQRNLHVHRVTAPATAWRPAQQGFAPVPTYPIRAARPTNNAPRESSPVQQVVKTVEEADTFSARTDGAATAAVLRSAAESGTPFCEECAKAAGTQQAA